MHARSALFDVYGDHLRTRGNRAPVAALVRLLEPVGIAAPAVRTAISRMVIQGWLESVSLPSGRGYAATEQAIRRLDRAGERIYRTGERDWDGRWQLLLLDPIRDRSARTRVRAALGWMGYAELGDGVWVSPWPQPELDALLAREQVTAARALAHDFDPPATPAACWDLAQLGQEYAVWLEEVTSAPRPAAWGQAPDGHDDPDRRDFAQRFHLVHDWRMFLFRDPGLPDVLLPADWPGRAAAAHFTEEADRLKPGADRFVDRCLY
ncbi:PaaX family transcriptional regulator [Nocardioides donggukensis]|uniref:PaaX family transcriptional regulator n=1 Tax=Nocardioides donggukensis TaxID=2774019 RepID=A0A927K5P1_9ACTN|nr:PaaX family transcriptional regulator C-terminal domain-containing protein [Nocardioides donggukensis]MBD8870288.1 PaaX family transcriptional regulator [Nocardioides donggukensis]